MSYNEHMELITRPAGADLSAAQYLLMDLDTTVTGAQVVKQTTAGGKVIGVLQNKPTSGQAALIAINGISKVVAGGTITAGDELSADTAGKAVTATTGKRIIGRALTSAVAGDIFPYLIQMGANVA